MLHPVVQSFILILYTLHNLIKLWNLYQISLGTLQCIAVAINHITVLLQILRIGSSNDHPRRNSIIDSESHASIKLRLCGRRDEFCLWPLSADHKVNASAAPSLRNPLHGLEERILLLFCFQLVGQISKFINDHNNRLEFLFGFFVVLYIVLFELKRPMRDDYNSSNNPVNQLYEYVSQLRSNKKRDKDGRVIRVGQNTKFYLYAVCDITTTLEQILDFHDFSQTPDKLGYYKYNDKMNAYIEILSYDKIINDAKKRNRILFDKLGI